MYSVSSGQGWDAGARGHVRTPFLYLGNRLAGRAQICCGTGSPLVTRFAHVMGPFHIVVYTCARAHPIYTMGQKSVTIFGAYFSELVKDTKTKL